MNSPGIRLNKVSLFYYGFSFFSLFNFCIQNTWINSKDKLVLSRNFSISIGQN